MKYQFLNNWDTDMMHLLGGQHGFQKLPIRKLWDKDDDQVLAFMRGNLVLSLIHILDVYKRQVLVQLLLLILIL